MREAPKRVLIVDDQRAWHDVIKRTLQKIFPGVAFVIATNWDEVVTHRQTTDIDLITMDGSLTEEGGEGIRFVRQLRAEGVTCPIIMISGDGHVVQGGVLAGANDGCNKSDVVDGGLASALRRIDYPV